MLSTGKFFSADKPYLKVVRSKCPTEKAIAESVCTHFRHSFVVEAQRKHLSLSFHRRVRPRILVQDSKVCRLRMPQGELITRQFVLIRLSARFIIIRKVRNQSLNYKEFSRVVPDPQAFCSQELNIRLFIDFGEAVVHWYGDCKTRFLVIPTMDPS